MRTHARTEIEDSITEQPSLQLVEIVRRSVQYSNRPSRVVQQTSGHMSGHTLYSENRFNTTTSLRGFFCLNAVPKHYRRGAFAPLKAVEDGLYLPIRQAEQEQSSGGRAQTRPPASQHDAVCGGGWSHPLTASCCVAGSGGVGDA